MVGSCVSHSNVSLIVWAKSQDRVHNPQFSKRKESRSGSNWGPSVYQPSVSPLAHNGSHYLYLSYHRYILPPFHIWFICRYSEAHYTIIAKILYSHSQCLVVHLDVAFHFHTINLKILLAWSHFCIYYVWNFTKTVQESTVYTSYNSFLLWFNQHLLLRQFLN